MSEKEKMNVNTAPAVDTSTGTAEDVEAIMKKYDRESNTRIWEGVPKTVVRYLLAAFALLMVYMNLFANWDERVRRSLFVGIVIILSFLVYPAKKGSTKKNHIPIYDIVLMVLGAGRAFPQVLKSIVYNLFYTTSGVIGTPIGVCSTYIALFILFGAFLEATGISEFFIQLANSLAGASTRGPDPRPCKGGCHLLGPLRNGIRKLRGKYSYHRLRDDSSDEKDGLQGRICRSC